MSTTKMLRIIAIMSLFASVVFLYDQDGFSLKFEHSEVVRCNEKYVKDYRIVNFKYNRTHNAMNISYWFLENFGSDIKIEIQAYKFMSNEYRPFPIRFAFNACTALSQNDFGLGSLQKCGNFSSCPFKKGFHRFCNWAPDATKFPPLIPDGSYMIDIKYFFGPIELMFAHGYGTVATIFKWGNS